MNKPLPWTLNEILRDLETANITTLHLPSSHHDNNVPNPVAFKVMNHKYGHHQKATNLSTSSERPQTTTNGFHSKTKQVSSLQQPTPKPMASYRTMSFQRSLSDSKQTYQRQCDATEHTVWKINKKLA
jgi:hypothetical protein